MRFVPYHELSDTPNIIVDGKAAGPSTVLTLSHWPGSGTPWELKDDLSAQIVFRYLDHPEQHVRASAASNNHFDEDGLVSLFTLLHPEDAQAQRERLVDVAAAGDFGTYRLREAARISFAIAAFADLDRSPLGADFWKGSYPETTARLYEEMLGRLPEMLAHPDRFRAQWAEEDAALEAGEAALRSGAIRIESLPELDLSVVTAPAGATPHPMALHNAAPGFRMLLFVGRRCELRYRYESWIQYVSRRPAPRVDLSPLAEKLSEEDGSPWAFSGVDEITPRMSRADGTDSELPLALLRLRVLEFLAVAPPAWDPYDPQPAHS
jgi:hypothetical protein